MKYLKKVVFILLVIIIISSVFAIGASASGTIAYGAATVGTQGLRVRSGPGTTYSIYTHLSEGDIVVILERTNKEWYNINFHGTIGYVSVPLLKDILTAENFNAVGKLTGAKVNVRSLPNISSDILGTYKKDTEMTVIGINNGWYKVKHDGKTGYVRSDYMDIISGHRASSASSKPSTPTSPAAPRVIPTVPAPDPDVALGLQISEFAQEFLGYKYVYGGASPETGFDCSGFVSYIYKSFGISVTRNASGQFRDNGVLVDKPELYPGDLVFFSNNGNKSVTHVGIYIGEDEFVHASRPGVGVVISRMDSSYYNKGYMGAKRLVFAQ